MIHFSDLIKQYENDLRTKYSQRLLPSHLSALGAMQNCRTSDNIMMMAKCNQCQLKVAFPHSCGHRNCPHCQQFECQQWIERQRSKLLPATYYMVTFTIPAELRDTAWRHQRIVYSLLFKVAWQTLLSFGMNDKKLMGKLGATAVLHTHSRALDYHPHVHFILPAGAINDKQRLWRKKKGKYLFRQKNLALVFRAKMLAALKEYQLSVFQKLPTKWVVDCKQMGKGDKALTYLGKYLYRGVLQEKNIIEHQDGKVTFTYTDNMKTQRIRTLSGADFLWLILQHILPRNFRRARDFGFLHSNSKRIIHLLKIILRCDTAISKPLSKRNQFCCAKCGAAMTIIATRLKLNTANPLIGAT